MSPMTMKLVSVTRMSWLVVVAACGSQELLDLGGDAGQSASESNVAASAGASSENGDGSGTTGGSFPCVGTVCSAPDVCCLQWAPPPPQPDPQGPRAEYPTGTCEPRASCDGGAVITCTALTCPAGSLCCVSHAGASDNDGGQGWSQETAQCIDGSSCPAEQSQACVPADNILAPPTCPDGGLCTCDHVTCTCP